MAPSPPPLRLAVAALVAGCGGGSIALPVDTSAPTAPTVTDTAPDTEAPDTEPPDTDTDTAPPDTDTDTDPTVVDTAPVDTVPAPDPSAFLFDDDVVRTFELTLPQESIDALVADPYTYVEGTLTFEGHTYTLVGVRTKGQNSWQPITQKASLKLKLDWIHEDQDFFGMKEVTLNAMNDDPTMMHERVAYRMYREAGVPAARAMHATVVLNGEPYGLYTHLDTVDRTFIRRWYANDAGPLFEQWDVDYYDQYIPCPAEGVPCFELEFGGDDRTALQGVADAMEVGSPAEKIAVASEHIDYEQFLLYWATGAVVGQFDAYPYSSPGDDCHVFFNADAGLLEYIPHGADETFSSGSNNVLTAARGILATTCLQDPDCDDAIRQRTWEIFGRSEEIGLLAYHDLVAAQIEDLVAADTNKSHSTSGVYENQGSMRSFIAGRESALALQIGPP